MKNWHWNAKPQISQSIYHHLPAFRWRNFRLLFLGQLLSMSGTFMTQQLAIPWLIYDLTQSAWLLGLAGFLQFLPTLLLIPVSGVLSDRWQQRDLLMLVQILGISISITLTILTFLDLITFEALLILSVLNGLLKGLDMPVRHTIVTHTVDDRVDWANAIALNSVMLSLSLVLGPALGGILMSTLGVKYCFLYDSLSYLAAILTLQAMHIHPMHQQAISENADGWQRFCEGFSYIKEVRPIRILLLIIAIKSVVGSACIALLPVFAADVLRGNASTLAMISAAGPVGALLACLYLSIRQSILGLERLILVSQALIGVGFFAVAYSRESIFSFLSLIVVGGFSLLHLTSSNTIIQSLVADDKRGRVMSFYALALVGMMPFGNLLAGGLAQHMGAPSALIVCGCICWLGSAWFFFQLPQLTLWIRKHLQTDASDKQEEFV
ncbi:MAG: MFS transporter [Cyanobacteriota bacterium]|nr:MFS transporter [Cyanobacteriota bacterium]